MIKKTLKQKKINEKSNILIWNLITRSTHNENGYISEKVPEVNKGRCQSFKYLYCLLNTIYKCTKCIQDIIRGTKQKTNENLTQGN